MLMKKTLIIIAALFSLVACKSLKEEWQPVFNFSKGSYEGFTPYTESYLKLHYGFKEFTTIADFKKMYKPGGTYIYDDIWIKGQVISEDRSGNIYKDLYIQDETGAMDVKIGKGSLYSEFVPGQWVYVNCRDMLLGAYHGQPQLGLDPDDTSTNEYESSYMDLQAIIQEHVFKGAVEEPIKPYEVSEAEVAESVNGGFNGKLWNRLVTIKNLTYGDEIFALLYPNPSLDHKSGNPENRLFLSKPDKAADVIAGFDYTWGIDTWAMSKAKTIEYVSAGVWDTAVVGSGSTRYGPITQRPIDFQGLPESVLQNFGPDAELSYKEIMIKYAQGNYVSHYFKMSGGTIVQVRTSGFSRFSDEKLDSRILDKSAKVTITGILAVYDGSAQFTLIDEPSKSVKLD